MLEIFLSFFLCSDGHSSLPLALVWHTDYFSTPVLYYCLVSGQNVSEENPFKCQAPSSCGLVLFLCAQSFRLTAFPLKKKNNTKPLNLKGIIVILILIKASRGGLQHAAQLFTDVKVESAWFPCLSCK